MCSSDLTARGKVVAELPTRADVPGKTQRLTIDAGLQEYVARRLGTKGYPAFVTTPAGAARVFRVRVGKFKERREAETHAERIARVQDPATVFAADFRG